MAIIIKHIDKPVRKEINLPASKSISNRVLIIKALCEKKFAIKNLSKADDTECLWYALQSKSKTIDAGEGGTTFRFLLAYLANKEGDWKLSGSKRLMERPVTPLLEALKKLGASIEKKSNHYLIKGKQLSGGKLSIDAGISSQFISAMLLFAPSMKKGLQLKLKGKIVSSSYIDMTVELMREFGIAVTMKGKTISVTPGKYQPKNFEVEADWSAASYFYELAALKPKSKILLKGLKEDSIQGDRIVAELFEVFGVKSEFSLKGVLISSGNNLNHDNKSKTKLIFDLKDNPDLFPALAVTVAAKEFNTVFKNISHLNLKESERANVFEKTLNQLGFQVKQTKNTFSIIENVFQPETRNPKLKTYNDHRVAMSLAPLATVFNSVTLEDKKVVDKSFPGFWKEFGKKNS